MRTRDLPRTKLAPVHAAVGGQLRYLNRLVERMRALRIDEDDGPYQAARKARDEVNTLWMALHYAQCDGVGEPARWI